MPWALALLLMQGAAQAQVSDPARTAGQLRFADVSVNGVPVADSAPLWYDAPRGALRTQAARFWLEAGLLDQLGLLNVAEQRLEVASRRFADLCASPRLACYFDEAQQQLSVWAPAELFAARRLGVERLLRRDDDNERPRSSGSLLAYELALNQLRGLGPGLSGLAEVSGFHPLGQARGQLALELRRGQREARAYGLQLRRDDAAQLRSWVLGQTLSQALPGRPSFAYTGLRWASNFALDPLQSQQSGPRFSGSLDGPSSVDVYIDGLRRTSERFDFGRFQLETPIGPAGASDISVVVRDASGQLRSTERLSYYFSPSLLRPGAVDQSLEAGYVARDGFRYRGRVDKPFVAYSERRGWSERSTTQATLQVGQPLARAGVGLTHTLLNWASLDWMSVWERASDGQQARRHVLGLERSAGQTSIIARVEHADRVLDAAPDRIGLSSLRRLSLLSLSQGLSSARTGPLSLNATVLQQQAGSGPRARAWQLGLQGRPRREIGWGLSLRRDEGPQRGTTLSFTLSLMLDGGLAGSAEWRQRPQGASQSLSAQRSHMAEGSHTGSDFAGLSRAPEGQTLLAHLEREQTHFRWRASAYRQPGFHLVQAAVSGALGRVDGVGFRSQRISDAFAVVRVDPYPDVPVFLNNRLVGHTDARGLLVLPSVPGQVPQTLAIDANALPVETAVPRPERQLTLARGQGALIDFEVASSASVTVRLIDARGEPLPPGQRVLLDHLAEPSHLGRRGMLYIERAEPLVRARARLADGRRCVALIEGLLAPAPPGNEPAYVCNPVTETPTP